MFLKQLPIFKTIAIAGVLFSLVGCNQDITLGTRSATDSLPLVTILGAPIATELGLSVDVAIDSSIIGIEADSQFLTFARIRDLRLEIQDESESAESDTSDDGAIDSFDFLSGLSVSIRASFGGVVQQEVVAFLPDGDPQFGTAARELRLSVVGSDLLDYLQASGGYQLVLNISGNVPPDAVIFGGAVRYRVGVGI